MQDATHHECVLGLVNSSELSDIMVIYRLEEEMTWDYGKGDEKPGDGVEFESVPPGRH